MKKSVKQIKRTIGGIINGVVWKTRSTEKK